MKERSLEWLYEQLNKIDEKVGENSLSRIMIFGDFSGCVENMDETLFEFYSFEDFINELNEFLKEE
jgi:hypothetical protein